MLLLASGLLLLVGCRATAPPAAPPTEPSPPPPQLDLRFLTVAQSEAAEAFMGATDTAAGRQAFLKAYAGALRDLKQGQGGGAVTLLLRTWEMSRVALATGFSAEEVRTGVGLAAAKTPPAARAGGTDQPLPGWRLATPGTFDADVRQTLQAVKDARGRSYSEFTARWLRYILVVEDKSLLADLPLEYEGTVDPLVGTAIIPARDAITSQRHPAWKIAAALVHEAEHVRWYYEVAGDEARLLLPVPDERNSYRLQHVFLQDARLAAGQGRLPGKPEAEDLARDMADWRQFVREANVLLGYPEDDMTERHDLTVGDEVLMTPPLVGSGPRDPRTER